MDGHEYVRITPELFMKHLAKGDGCNAFISQEHMAKNFRKTVELCTRAKGTLFAHNIVLITEELSPLAIRAIEKIAKRNRYIVTCDNPRHQLEYIGSDGTGHYSTDYYRLLRYGRVLVTSA